MAPDYEFTDALSLLKIIRKEHAALIFNFKKILNPYSLC